MNYKKKFKKRINDSIDTKNSYSKISSILQFQEEKNKEISVMKNKKLVYGLTAGCACAVIVGVGLGVGLGLKENNKFGTATSMVTMELNPSISMVLDENNKVLSVKGNNNEGKIIIANENFVGLPLDQAVNKVITIESECGYLINGKIETDQNHLNFEINVDDEVIKETIKNCIDMSVKSTCENLHIDQSMSYINSMSKEALIEMVVYMDPTLTKEDCANMTYKELLSRVAIYHLDTAEFYSVELENLYNQSKNYEIKFAESDFNKNVIASLGTVYNSVVSSLNLINESLKNSTVALESANYKAFVDEESSYQKTYKSFLESKKEVIELKNKLANYEISETDKAIIKAKLIDKERALDILIKSLEEIKNGADYTLKLYKETIEGVVEQIDKTLKSLPDQNSVEKALSEKSKELENKLNDAKKDIYKNFEDKYGSDIKKAKDNALQYKNELKAKLQENLTK